MAWVRIGSDVTYQRLHICVSNVVGDGKSSDHINQMKQGGGAFRSPRPCRFCTVPFVEMDNAFTNCKSVRMKDIVTIVDELWGEDGKVNKETRSILKRISIHEAHNAFSVCDFGANEHGIVLACSPDVMHMLELGMINYVSEVFVRSMTTNVRVIMDDLVDNTFTIRSSIRNQHLRMNFARGATAISLLTAKEWPGLILSYLIVLKSSPDSFRKCFSPNDMQEPDRPEVDKTELPSVESGVDSEGEPKPEK